MKHNFYQSLFLIVALIFIFNQIATAQNGEAGRQFRGTIGGKNVEMRLFFDKENNVRGSYRYQGGRGELALKGRLAGDKLTLEEFDSNKKKTGSFKCEVAPEDEEATMNLSCDWQKPSGDNTLGVTLTEQHVEFTNNLQIAAKQIVERRLAIAANYPQIVGANSPAIAKFNSAAAALVAKLIKGYKTDYEPIPGETVYSLDYNILLATNDLISVEFVEDYSGNSAYPNSATYSLNYSLQGAGREIKAEELFKPKTNFRAAIAKFSLESINKELKSQNQSDLPAEYVSDFDNWALTRKGIVVYYEFPHVLAALGRVFVPFSALREHLNERGAAIFR
ncbi:MAG: RsiV family protein [Pyrinomonadaceae bacterium]